MRRYFLTKEQRYKNEQAEKCFLRKGSLCVHCHKPATQLAHKIPQQKRMLKKYGYKIIHHWLNRDPVCSLECNSKSSVSNHPITIDGIVALIEEGLKHET
jgi:hypothetical protein